MTVTTINAGYTVRLNKSLKVFFGAAWRIMLTQPHRAYSLFRTAQWQNRAAKTRASYEKQGIHVPPIIIYSVTERCNLHCQGCYAAALHDKANAEMDTEKMRHTIREARDLGAGFMIIAGGEPMVRRELLNIIAEFKEMIFFVFTNGTLINDVVADRIKRLHNLVPVISLEGGRAETDGRRGKGVYDSVAGVIQRLKKRHIFFGTSFTLTSRNVQTVAEGNVINDLYRAGCKLFFFMEYTPVDEGTADWEVTDAQRNLMAETAAAFRKKYRALFINLPEDEKDFNGCLAAGRGFIHISAQGAIEPCPFIPYSDTNLKESTLKDALQSDFLAAIRENSSHMEEGKGGCALWHEREWLTGLLAEHQRRKEIAAEPVAGGRV